MRSALEAATRVENPRVSVDRRAVDYELAPTDLQTLEHTQRRHAALVSATPPSFIDEDKRVATIYALSLRRIIERLMAGEDIRRPLLVHTLGLSDELTLTGVGSQPFVAIARRVQDQLGSGHRLLSCTNGHVAYIPTREAFVDPYDPYPAYRVPILQQSLPFREDIADRLFMTIEASVLAARTHRSRVDEVK